MHSAGGAPPSPLRSFGDQVRDRAGRGFRVEVGEERGVKAVDCTGQAYLKAQLHYLGPTETGFERPVQDVIDPFHASRRPDVAQQRHRRFVIEPFRWVVIADVADLDIAETGVPTEHRVRG